MTMCATGPTCGNTLPVHARRRYCVNCRAVMATWAKRRPAEVLDHSRRLQRGIYRVEHLEERTMDLQESLSQLRKKKREKRAPIRRNGERARL